MLSKNSRYRQLSDEVTVDARGRRMMSKNLRSLPQVTGIFRHTLEDGDRLDHLAHKYYGESRKWWRICDANPEFMSPQDLLGKTPFVMQQFPLSFPQAEPDQETQPPWCTLINSIAAQVGVQDVWLADEENLLIIIFNQINIQSSTLLEMIGGAGFTVEQPQTINRTGKQIIIPPDILS